jgi:hypothetical protein
MPGKMQLVANGMSGSDHGIYLQRSTSVGGEGCQSPLHQFDTFGAGVGASRAYDNTAPSGDTPASRRPRPIATPAAIAGTAGRPAVMSTAAASAAGRAVARPALHSMGLVDAGHSSSPLSEGPFAQPMLGIAAPLGNADLGDCCFEVAPGDEPMPDFIVGSIAQELQRWTADERAQLRAVVVSDINRSSTNTITWLMVPLLAEALGYGRGMPFQQTAPLLQRLQRWGYLPVCPVPLWVALPLTLPACGGCGGWQPPVLSPSSLSQPALNPASLRGCHVGVSVPKVSGLRGAGCWLVLEAPLTQCVWAAGRRLRTQWFINHATCLVLFTFGHANYIVLILGLHNLVQHLVQLIIIIIIAAAAHGARAVRRTCNWH